MQLKKINFSIEINGFKKCNNKKLLITKLFYNEKFFLKLN